MHGLWTQFSFKGRLSRIDFWRRGMLLSVLLAVVWASMMFATLASPLGPLVALLVAPILVASISATIRRLHDRGRSLGWLLAVSGGVGACVGLGTLSPNWAARPIRYPRHSLGWASFCSAGSAWKRIFCAGTRDRTGLASRRRA